MAVPTQPTATLIATEALTRFLNGGTPTSAEITRAINEGLEKVKRDLMIIGKTWRPLIITSYAVTTAYKQEYTNPADFEVYQSVAIMSGNHSGTGQGGDVDHFCFAADEDMTVVQAEGNWVVITGGTGANQAAQIQSYDVGSKTATLASSLATASDATSTYLVANSIKDLVPLPKRAYDLYSTPGTPGLPQRYFQLENSSYGSIALHPVPDAVYGIRRRYYADFMQMDTDASANPLYNTILRRWASVLTQGVFVWKLGEDDDRYQAENQIYQSMLTALMARDLDGYKPSAE